ncbi:endonuclease/exonuclease/phosphatase family protein [uncultured Roseovarius sp.]|uniref:endonuclease/exonuclease/phosphatase family protein n=1 Tax=Roseovarius sp. TaxID=1486281 RepID=UPI0025D5031A|nr:endonuclease/exonuclease/phosphatase family protein [uncultured Roseovarius sp.]
MVNSAILRVPVFASATVLTGLVLLGFSGEFFAPGNSAAVVRPLAGILLLPLTAVLWRMKAPRRALFSLAWAIVALGSVAPSFFTSGVECTRGCVKLYQKNLLSKAWPRYPLADDIIASGAEIVTLQEVSDHNRQYMAKLFGHYPNAVTCTFRPAQDVAVLTSLPAVDRSEFCLTEAGLAGIQVLAPNGRPIWVLSIHLEWPFPFDQDHQSQIIAKRIAELDGPVLIAGDFNMVPWAGNVQRIQQAAGTDRLGAFHNTFRLGGWLLPLPIDMVLVPKGASGGVGLRPYMGSDHLGVLARISLP